MGQALYRKYRSKSLDEIVGQDHITHTLAQAVKSGRISHAYLLTGPRGVGKTSIARILAHEINGLPYTDDSSHLDIIEIDAASNRRIDEIRELREKVFVAPTSAKYKVYIIDEVHMLTKEAFNALLKTLEEPPAHVVFILATTDAHKLPETIISRTQRYSFKPVPADQVVAHLREIATKEKIDIDDGALNLLAEHGEGSFRDSISLLDQASSRGESITQADIESLLGIPPTTAVKALLESVTSAAGITEVMKQLSQLYIQGYQASSIAKQLGQLLRKQLIENNSPLDSDTLLTLLSSLLEVPAAHDPERLLEIVLLRALPATAGSAPVQKVKAAPAPVVKVKPVKQSEPEVIVAAVIEEVEVEPVVEPEPVVVEAPKKAKPSANQKLNEKSWPEVLNALKVKYNTLYGVARMAQPDFSTPGTLRLKLKFAFHAKRISEAKNRQAILDVIQQVTGESVALECVLDTDAAALKASTVAVTAQPAVLDAGDLVAISNIFGGGELLES